MTSTSDAIRAREAREAFDEALIRARTRLYQTPKEPGVFGMSSMEVINEARPDLRAVMMLNPTLVEAGIDAIAMRRIKPIMGRVTLAEVTATPFLAGLDIPVWVSVPPGAVIAAEDDDEDLTAPPQTMSRWVHILDLTAPMLKRIVEHRQSDIDGRMTKMAPLATLQRQFDLWREALPPAERETVKIRAMEEDLRPAQRSAAPADTHPPA